MMYQIIFLMHTIVYSVGWIHQFYLKNDTIIFYSECGGGAALGGFFKDRSFRTRVEEGKFHFQLCQLAH